MYVKQIVLEGFKSYRDRTVIGPFDPHFNAITGLNGSGKSNILDAICFVLGVTSLNTVRATCLGDLVYKGAGVTRASVSITFDNSDKTPGKCPFGYEKFPEIIVSRVVDSQLTCKYFLNSLVSTKTEVCEMFHTVGININNPNFIIMQGKITKVVNMKPIEVLLMIEETCGATTYQKKRDKIAKEINERERKLEGMEKVIRDVIQPALEEQIKASTAVQECHHTQKELNEKEKQLAVISYLHHTKQLRDAEQELQQAEQNENTEQEEIEEANKEIERQNRAREDAIRNAAKNDATQKLAKKVDELKPDYHAKKAQLDSAAAGKQEAADKVKKAEKDFEKEQKEVEKFRNQSKQLIEEFEAIKTEIKGAEESLKKAIDTEEKLQTGNLISESGDVVNVREQLNEMITTVAEAKSKSEELKVEAETVKKAISEKEKEMSKCPENDEVEGAFQQAQKDVSRFENILRQKQINPADASNVETSIEGLKVEKSRLDSQQQRVFQQYPYLSFRYDKPTPNFNTASVVGFFYEKFKVKDLEKFGGALEVAVGGSCGKMLVDKPETSRLLIDKGNLARRTTFLPISAMQSYPLKANLQSQLNSKFGPGQAFVALDLVEYDPQLKAVMQSIFGNTVITTDLNQAKKVAFELKCRAVTLDGDVADPSGTMQGGSRQNLGHLMRACQQLLEIKTKLRQIDQNLLDLEKQADVCRQNQKLVTDHAEALRKLKQCQELRSLTTRATVAAELEALKLDFEKKEHDYKQAVQEFNELKKKEQSYQKQLMNESTLRKKNLTDCEKDKKKWEKALQAAKTKYESKQNLFKDVEVELAAKAEFLTGFQKDIDEAKSELTQSEEFLKRKQEEYQKIDQEFQARQNDLLKAQATNKELEEHVANIAKKIEDLGNKIHQLELEQLKRKTVLKDHQAKINHYRTAQEKVVQENRSIEFSPNMDPGTNKNLDNLQSEVRALKKRHEDLRVRLDFEKAASLNATKAKVAENQQMYRKTQQSRKQIEQTIRNLDQEKLRIVQRGYDQINAEFSTMMGMLLPDSQAKLVPVNPNRLSDGLNIHVKLGNVWKESLTELSGGQRSLVALSLVLSLCMYNPAPMYVLDEIDAALDLSHTQNIGYLLKHKFKNTQFICVSLKDGMYVNANVLFQTQLLNGTSCVKRTTPGGSRPRH